MKTHRRHLYTVENVHKNALAPDWHQQQQQLLGVTAVDICGTKRACLLPSTDQLPGHIAIVFAVFAVLSTIIEREELCVQLFDSHFHHRLCGSDAEENVHDE